MSEIDRPHKKTTYTLIVAKKLVIGAKKLSIFYMHIRWLPLLSLLSLEKDPSDFYQHSRSFIPDRSSPQSAPPDQPRPALRSRPCPLPPGRQAIYQMPSTCPFSPCYHFEVLYFRPCYHCVKRSRTRCAYFSFSLHQRFTWTFVSAPHLSWSHYLFILRSYS